MDKGLSWDYAECGKSNGWPEREREAERRQTTRFGPYWAVDKVKRPNGRSYTTRQSPYDPKPGYVGIWKGRTAPPPRIGAAAPKRWPAEAPDGLRPYKYKEEQENASRAITDGLGLSDDPHNYQRLRDLKAHILEGYRRRAGYFWAEIEGIELYRRHDQLRWFVDAGFEMDGAPGIDSAIANSAGYGFQEVDNTVERRRRRRPPRERRKPGRKPLGERAMTTRERVARHRARQKQIKAPATHGRLPAGTVQPLPLGLAVPVPTFASTDDSLPRSFLDQGAAMSATAEPTAGPRMEPHVWEVGPFLLPGSLREWREVCSGPEVAPPLAPRMCVDGGEIPDFLPARELREAA